MSGTPGEAAARWRDALERWAIPAEILAAAPVTPWTLPRETFARRADRSVERPRGSAFARALEALPEGGTVLDVGSGAGAASLPLLPRASTLVAVDGDPKMLELLAERAARAGRPVRLVEGRWPDVERDVPAADVVVCAHVLYNVPDLVPFAAALAAHARRRVVVEITARHPLTPMTPLWRRFHGIARPTSPTWEDARDVLLAMGLPIRVERELRTEPPSATFEELVRTTRTRLCLGADRDAEIANALREQGQDGRTPSERDLVTLWWDKT